MRTVAQSVSDMQDKIAALETENAKLRKHGGWEHGQYNEWIQLTGDNEASTLGGPSIRVHKRHEFSDDLVDFLLIPLDDQKTYRTESGQIKSMLNKHELYFFYQAAMHHLTARYCRICKSIDKANATKEA
ncbi:MAG: hypothetical protein C4542_08020 [Dehalococcoidia bacterium]|nr:MAG: hypothetical protein C4542_08020 [Dehalococcoidia bacterium]